jgi:flagellar protein FliO/FliZ
VLELTVRLAASLAVVVGLLLVLARVAGRRFAGRAGAPIQVLHRQPLSRSSSVAMISVGSRVLLVGSTDHQVSLLAEVDPEELDLPEEVELTDPDAFDGVRPTAVPTGALAGSLLAAGTWKAAFAAATGKRP